LIVNKTAKRSDRSEGDEGYG